MIAADRERQLSATDEPIAPDVVERLGEVIFSNIRSENSALRQGYARRSRTR